MCVCTHYTAHICTQHELFLLFSCCLYYFAGQTLLDEESIQPGGMFKMTASSEAGNKNRAVDGVITIGSGSGSGNVWKSQLPRDTDQYLQCNAVDNVNISSIGVAGVYMLHIHAHSIYTLYIHVSLM